MVPVWEVYTSMLGELRQCPIAAFQAALSEWRQRPASLIALPL